MDIGRGGGYYGTAFEDNSTILRIEYPRSFAERKMLVRDVVVVEDEGVCFGVGEKEGS